MTLQIVLRTWAIAVLGAAALALASQARSESGDGSTVISPEQAQAFLESAGNGAEAEGEQEKADEADARKPATAAKRAEKQKPKGPAAAAGSDGAEAAGKQGGESSVEQTAAIPLNQFEMPPRAQQADTARAAALKPLITRYASENGLPYGLADAIVRLESRYNPGARNGPNMGLTQINFRTAQSLGYQGTSTGLLDAETNLRYGLKYLAQAYKLAGGDTCGTILRYQFGHRTQTMTGASHAYCAKVKVITAAAE